MAKLTLKKSLTDVTVYLFVQDSSKTTGEGLTGLAYNTANLVASYVRPLGSRTAITLATLAAVTSAHTDGGFKEIDATNMPGVYRLDLPDAVCATGVPSSVVMLKGASNMTPVLLEIQLTDFDLNSTSNTVGTVTNLTNLPSIPNNWLTAAGIAADAGAEIADAVWDEAISGHTTAGSFGAKNQKVVPSETIGDYKADVSGLATTSALTTVGNNVTAIKTKTDNLPSDPADDSDIDAQLAEIKGYVDDLESRLTATRAGYLDAAISTRLATSGYTAPPSVGDIATAVWGNATRTLSSFGTLIADIWGHATRTLSAFAFTVTGAKDASVDAIKAKTDTIPASPAAVGSAMTLTVGERTAIANEVESQIIDDTDAEKVLKAITDKIASVNPSLDDLTLAGIASAVRTELTTELARIDAAISSRLASVGYTAPDNASVTAIKAKTDNLPASPAAVGSAMTLSNNAITAAVIATDAIDADAIKADAITEIATGVWASATRTLSSFGTLVSDIWSTATRTLSSFGFTVATNSDANVTAIKAKTDNLPAIPAAIGSAMTLTSGERTAIANEVEAQIINETDSEKVLKAITDKIAEVNPSLDDLTLTSIAAAVRTELAIELGRIDAAISSRLASAGYIIPDNLGIAAVKAKTDQLVFTVANQVDANALTGGASPADVADAVWDEAIAGHVTAGSFGAKNQKVVPSESLNDYKTDISSLALESTLTAIKGIGWTSETLKEIKNRIDALPIGISTADIMNTVVEGTFTLQDVLKIMAGALAGKLDGGGTGTLTFRNLSDTLDRIIAEVDLSNGNRDNITLDLS